MLEQICNILEVITIFICNYLVKEYVFLEPELPQKKRWWYYGISAVIIAVSYLIWGKQVAEMVSIILIGLNIWLARKTRRWAALLLMPVIVGIINGITVPILVVPPCLFYWSQRTKQIYQLVIYGGIAILLFLFCVCGKNWRRRFRETIQHRDLQVWERVLLYIAGVLMVVFSNEVETQSLVNTSVGAVRESLDGVGMIYEERARIFLGISSVAALVMTIIIIVLIMEGNKRSYYHEKMMDMQFHIITMMADIVENRDENTGGHIKRTAMYVEQIAKELQRRGQFPEVLNKRYISEMVVAAPLHDIGKIHISDTILNKPGRLTEEEFAIMKTHTTAGRDLLNHAREELGNIDYLNIALDMATYHHEWWNGNGYPEGKKGEEIPVCARIMAVADVFDALTSKRCYKDAMPLEKAYRIIREESGTHFDEVVVDAFFGITDQLTIEGNQ